MTISQDSIALGRYTLQTYEFLPEGEAWATAVLVHGQGDYSLRYAPLLKGFQERGIAVVGIDLPGHGHSSGRRGHIPGFDFVDDILDQARLLCEKLAPGAPIGLLGHSCGALMALHSLFKNPDYWSFSWLSSPLVHPEGTRWPIESWFFLMVSRILPFVSIDSGVGPAQCVNGPVPKDKDARLHEDSVENLFHRRITLAWAQAICDTARGVRKEFPHAFPDIPVLITQGEDDPVCRAKTIRELVAQVENPGLTLEVFPGLRHEPFAEKDNALVVDRVARFLDEQVLSLLPHPDTARGT